MVFRAFCIRNPPIPTGEGETQGLVIRPIRDELTRSHKINNVAETTVF